MITWPMPFSTPLKSLGRMLSMHAKFLSVLHFTHNNLSFFWNSLLFRHLQVISLWNTADSCHVCMLLYRWLMLYMHALLLTPICACFTADSYCVCMLNCWLILCVHALLLTHTMCACITAHSYCVCMLYCSLILCMHACITADSYYVCMLYCWLTLCENALLKHWNSGRWFYNTLHNKIPIPSN